MCIDVKRDYVSIRYHSKLKFDLYFPKEKFEKQKANKKTTKPMKIKSQRFICINTLHTHVEAVFECVAVTKWSILTKTTYTYIAKWQHYKNKKKAKRKIIHSFFSVFRTNFTIKSNRISNFFSLNKCSFTVFEFYVYVKTFFFLSTIVHSF